MIIKTITSQELSAFSASQAHSQFLQTAAWQTLSPGNWKNIGIFSDAGQLLIVAAYKSQSLLRFFSYLYIPRGPIFKNGLSPEEQLALMSEMLIYLKRENPKAWFFRLEPPLAIEDYERLSTTKAWKKSLDLEPAKTLVLDLSLSEDELLASFHQKTRYNIRLADKKGVTVAFGGQEQAEAFLDLMEETGNRDGFKIHGRSHYRRLIEGQPDFLQLGAALYEGRLLAAGLFAGFGDTFTYVHGASSNNDRQLMAPYALQWEAIKIAKERGYRYYDFFGIDEVKWPGVTRFKLGFGGETITYPGTVDYVVNNIAYSLYQRLRALRRRF